MKEKIHSSANFSGTNLIKKFKARSQCLGFLSCKDKAIPLQAWTGPEGSRRLRLPDFKTIGT